MLSNWIRGHVNKNKEFLLDVSAVAFLWILVGILFWKVLFAKDLVIAGHDLQFQFQKAKFVRDQMQTNHVLPLWNPYLFSGTPFTPWLYLFIGNPFTALCLFSLPLSTAFNCIYAIPFLLGSLFMYVYARKSLQIARFASLVSAITFASSGFFVLRLTKGHLGTLGSFVWLPLIFFLFEKMVEKVTLESAFWLGGAIGLMMLWGNIQYPIITFLALFFCLAIKSLDLVRGERDYQRVFKLLGLLSLSIMIGSALGAIYLFPNYKISTLFHRSGEGWHYDLATGNSLHSLHLITAIFPDLFGNSLYGDYEAKRSGYYHEQTFYSGILPLLLALLAVIVLFWRSKSTRLFTTLVFFSIILGMGRYTPVYRLLYNYVPAFDKVRIPSKFLALFVFSTSALAGLGAALLVERRNERENKRLSRAIGILDWASIVLGALVILWTIPFENTHIVTWFLLARSSVCRTMTRFLVGPPTAFLTEPRSVYVPLIILILALILLDLTSGRSGKRLGVHQCKILIVLLTVVDLGWFGLRFIEPCDVNAWSREREVIRFLQKDSGLYRIFSFDAVDVVRFDSNMGEVHQLQGVDGYSPYILERYNEYINGLEDRRLSRFTSTWLDIENYKSALTDLLNVKYVPSDESLGDPQFELVFEDASGLKIYENTARAPRAFVVHRVEIIKEDTNIMARLKSDDFNWRESAILEQDPGVKLDDASVGIPGTLPVSVTDYSPNKIELQATLEDDGLLILSEVYYPGWKAYVDNDNKERKVYRANYLFRAIYLERGEHNVKFVFDPIAFKVGWIVSLLTAGLFVVAILCKGWMCLRR